MAAGSILIILLVSACFRVQVKTRRDETVCIVGDSPELGSWDPHHAVILRRETKRRAKDAEHPVSFEESADEGYVIQIKFK